MPIHLSTASDNGELTGHDRLTCFLIGRLQVIEAALFIIASQSEDFEQIKVSLNAIVASWRDKAKAGDKSEFNKYSETFVNLLQKVKDGEPYEVSLKEKKKKKVAT